MSKKALRKKLFELHSADLHSICPETENAFRCPICLSLYSAKDLDERLTDGHIWPQELRRFSEIAANQRVLLCKDCNSESGSSGDKHLQTLHQIRETRKSNERLGTRQFQFMKDDGESFLLRGNMTFDTDALKGDLELPAKINRPSELEAFHNATLAGENFMILEYNARPHRTELAQVGLITAGYLFAFYFFGYRYIVQEDLNAVRAYILSSFQYKEGPRPELPKLNVIEAFEYDEYHQNPVAGVMVPLDGKTPAHFQVRFLNYVVKLPIKCVPEIFHRLFVANLPKVKLPDKDPAILWLITDSKMNRPEWIWDSILGTFPVIFVDDE